MLYLQFGWEGRLLEIILFVTVAPYGIDLLVILVRIQFLLIQMSPAVFKANLFSLE